MDFKQLMVVMVFTWITPAHAESAWKCTAANGSITLQNMPCSDANLTHQEMLTIETFNHIGRDVTPAERERNNSPNSIHAPQGSNWNQPQKQQQSTPASNQTVANCDRINSRIEQIQRELRAGYRAERGNRLKRERNDLYNARKNQRGQTQLIKGSKVLCKPIK